MASYKEQRSRDSQSWQARLARERLNLSESVEETLADPSSMEQWPDEEQQYIPVDASPSGTELVPPRLSLQSKVLPSVRPVSFVQSVTNELAAQQPVAEQPKPQNTNMFARFAQRFTSSIAAIMQPDTYTWEPTQPEQDNAPQEKHLATLPPTSAVAPIESAQKPTVIDAIPATPSQPLLPPVKSKQRLAGHTAKVHLQTAQMAKATPYPKEEKDVYGWSVETNEPLREPLTVNVRLRERAQPLPSPIQLAAPSLCEEIQTGQEKLLEEKPVHAVGIDYVTFFGTGLFQKGQGELMVRNTYITETSVVHVTLTSNPGPTLVQYISLHPEVGFTLHLTAPADTKTTFNYILFTKACL